MVKMMSIEESYEHLRASKITPDMLILEYNANHSRAKVVIDGACIMVTNFMKPENAQKVINGYRQFCKKVITLQCGKSKMINDIEKTALNMIDSGEIDTSKGNIKNILDKLRENEGLK